MARQARNPPLNVFLNSRRVGVLRKESSGAVDFAYDPAWLAWESALPVSLSLPLREERYIGAPVLAVFDNLLPDNNDIRRVIAARVGAGGTDAYNLLGAIGRDCVGALQFLPADEAPGPAGAVDGAPLTDARIGDLLDNLTRAPLGLGDDDAFRISLAGAQEKTALLRRDGAWFAPHGTTATTHILKPQIGEVRGLDLSRSVENEYLCMKLTKAVGLPVADVEIIDFDGRRALVVERFDRRWARDGRLLRLPQEDMCQVLSTPSAIKYEADGGPGMERILRALSASDQRLGSRIAEVHNGSSLFTGDAGQGESNIRRWIIENDWLEAIVALPLNLFYNTGIATYVWVLSNRKAQRRKGKVQLIDATAWFRPLRKNLGKKNCELTEADIDRIVGTFIEFKETEQSKLFANADFGYWKVTVERPLRARGIDPERAYSPREIKALKDDGRVDPEGEPVIRRIHRPGKHDADPLASVFARRIGGKACTVEYEPNPELRDTEQVPLTQPGGIEAFIRREVLPHAPDAWVEEDTAKIGYEISFTRYFYKPKPLRDLADIRADILVLERETEGLLGEIVGKPA